MGAEDEATFGLIPNVARGWARKGSHPIAIIHHANICTNVFAARSQKSFVFSFSKHKKQPDFVRFLEKLQKKWGKVVLFIDRGPCHRGAKVRKFLAEHKKTFRIFNFPRYTPELNPVEQCWKPGRKKLSNRLIKTLPTAQYHLRREFKAKNMPKMFNYLRD